MERINPDIYFEELIDRYGNLVFSICYKISGEYFEAEDLAQETFLSVYQNLTKFDGSNEKAWICKIATNKCLDHLKSAKKRIVPTESEFFTNVESKDTGPERNYLDTELKERLYELCSNLKPPYNEVAIDYFCNDLEIHEIATKTGKNIKTLQTQMYRAKEMLRQLWRKETLE